MRHLKPLETGFRTLILLMSLVGLLTCGCVDKSFFNTSSRYYQSVETDSIETEIVRLEKIITDDPGSPAAAQSFYYLSLLYSHHKNPQPDYRNAGNMLESHIRLDPKAGEKSDVQYLLSLFRQTEQLRTKIEKLRTKNNALQRDKTKLKSDSLTLNEEKARLTAENQNLRGMIEQLKLLDVQLEERRKMF